MSDSRSDTRHEADLRDVVALARRLIDALANESPATTGLRATMTSARRELEADLLEMGRERESDYAADERLRRTQLLAARLHGWRQYCTEARASNGSRRRWLQPERRYPIRLEPRSGISVRSADDTASPWLATDNDPQFLLHGLERFAGSWVELSFRLDIVSGLGGPVLYIDERSGFSEETSTRIARPWAPGSRSSVLLFVSPSAVAFRLDPLSSHGSFRLDAVQARRISRPFAAVRMLIAIQSANRLHEVLSFSAPGALVRGFRRRMQRVYTKVAGNSYLDWISAFEPPPSAWPHLIDQQKSWKRHPLISVLVPAYNTPDKLLRGALDSVLAQTYANWELCIANDASTKRSVRTTLDEYASRDARVKVVHRSRNGHISEASNSALALATGEFIALLDHDDRLHPLALHFVAKAIVENPTAGIVYTDEDKVDEIGRRFAPYFKCEFNEQLFLSQNMICHLGCYRRELVHRVGGFHSEFDGSQDYDLALRIVELLDRRQVVHIPRVLYHWRAIEGSTSLHDDAKPYAHIAARRAIQAHLDRIGVRARVFKAPESKSMNRVRYALPDDPPSVCVIIPTRDRVDLLGRCIASLRDRTTYRNYSVCVIDNGSVEPETHCFLDRERQRGLKVIRDDSPFNFSALNNRAARDSDADYLVLMNNDIEVVSPDWIDEMIGHAIQPRVGAVGARLWYPDGHLQHGGVIVGLGGVAGHAHKWLPRRNVGYFARAVLQQQFSAVTGACLMISRSIYLEVGGLDETLRVAFNDVDFCLRLVERGYRNVWTPYAEFIHHESASRGAETTPDKQARFFAETSLMKERWGTPRYNDPAYSPNLTLATEDFAMAWPPRHEPSEETDRDASVDQSEAS
jgi:GT2 family glycosyltransferase